MHAFMCETYFGVEVFHRSMVNRRVKGYVCLRYMSILLYVKLIWCSGVPYIYGRLEEGEGRGTSILGICAYFYV